MTVASASAAAAAARSRAGSWMTALMVAMTSPVHAQPAADDGQQTGSEPISGSDKTGSDPISGSDKTGSDPTSGPYADPPSLHAGADGTTEDERTFTLHLGPERAIALHVEHEREKADRVPILSVDPILMSRFEGLAETQSRETTTISRGATKLVLEGIASSNVDRVDTPAIDLPYHGWHVGARLSHRIGPFDLEAGGALHHDETQYAVGTYYDIGVALTYRFKLAESMRAWISLGIGRRTWIGDAPDDREPIQSTTLMLKFGSTF